MYSKVKSMGHPLHLMLVNFPLGLLVTAAVFDIVHVITGNGYWSGLAFWMIAAGAGVGLLAATAGAIDLSGVPSGTHAKRIGIIHGSGNATVLLLFIVSWLLRLSAPENPSILAYVLSFLGAGMLFATGWLGGELTGRFGVGIEEDANVDAPYVVPGLLPKKGVSPAREGSARGEQTVVE